MSSPRSQRFGPFEVKLRQLTVSALEPISPSLTRVTLQGRDLEGFVSRSPDDHVKVFFPRGDGDVPAWDPSLPPSERPPMRDFTPRRFDASQLVIDFVVHPERADDGPAARWIRNARVGQTLGIGGPRGSIVVAANVDQLILLGDDTAIPAIARRLEELAPEVEAHVAIEVESAAHEIPLPTSPRMHVRWLHRDRGESLTSAIEDMPKPTATTFVWAGVEASVARVIRARYADVPKDATRISGYWERGVADHHD